MLEINDSFLLENTENRNHVPAEPSVDCHLICNLI